MMEFDKEQWEKKYRYTLVGRTNWQNREQLLQANSFSSNLKNFCTHGRYEISNWDFVFKLTESP